MGLEIYRRHTPPDAKKPCVVHTLDLTPNEKRYYRDCNCPIWIEGRTDTQIYPRQSLGTRDWKTGETKLRSLIGEGKDETIYGLKLSECVKKFLDSCKNEMGAKAHRSHVLLLKRLAVFAATKNKFFISELDVDTLQDFETYGLPTVKKSTSRSNMMAKLNVFLREAYRRGWTAQPLVEKVKWGKAVHEQKQPYTDEEVKLILEEAEKLNGGTKGYATNGHTFQLMLELMLETGLRVSDAVRFDPSRMFKSKHLWTYTFTMRKRRKTDKPKTAKVYLTDRLHDAIVTCKWFMPGLPFAYHTPSPKDENDDLSQAVYERMQNMGERIGITDCRPHRLRDTFAVRALKNGMTLGDVSRLLCHSSIKVTEDYYAPWVPDRDERVEMLLADVLKQY